MGPSPLEGPAVNLKRWHQRKHKEHEEHKAKRFSFALFLSVLSVFVFQCFGASRADDARSTVVVVIGAEGPKEYGEQFREWAGRWEKAASQAQAEFAAIGLAESSDKSDRDLLQAQLAKIAP